MSQRSSLRSVCLVVMVAVCAALPAQADAPVGQYTASMGMVTDNKTGLIWQQAEAPGTYTWSNAKGYCTNLDLNGAVWRLPTVKELLTLVDVTWLNPPAIDTSVNGFPAAPPDLFWSTTDFAGSPSLAWLVDFDGGRTYYLDEASMYRVRCVR